MSTNPARTPIIVGVAATVVLLITAALLTPDQSPILPIEISVVLVAPDRLVRRCAGHACPSGP